MPITNAVIISLTVSYQIGYHARMKLSEYLQSKKIIQADFAEKIGEKPQTVNRYIKGVRIPEPEIMRKIFEATGGAVTANDFYGLEVRKRTTA